MLVHRGTPGVWWFDWKVGFGLNEGGRHAVLVYFWPRSFYAAINLRGWRRWICGPHWRPRADWGKPWGKPSREEVV